MDGLHHGCGPEPIACEPHGPVFQKGMRVRLLPTPDPIALVGASRSGTVLGISGVYLAIELDNGMVVSAHDDDWRPE